ncbi:hypothetical protein PYW08_011966 [Mythimna loreyi]|uniref:Uncharacterized protein n=1 Tax=Mythimna loreyi TaxID=667449 RepID=A0ACC2QKY4_9NEOP|nr:hypothetical protein PYW08_011966 [Mythimna loreyi]
MADKILEQTQPYGSVAAVCSTSTTPAATTSIEEKIDALAREIAELKTKQQSHPNYRRRSFNRRYSRSRSRSSSRPNHDRARNTQSAICFYHRKFGKEARRCTRPCSYENSSAPSGN